MTSQHWFHLSLGAARQQAVGGANTDQVYVAMSLDNIGLTESDAYQEHQFCIPTQKLHAN